MYVRHCTCYVRGRSQTTLTRRAVAIGGTGNVNGIQTVKEFLRKCQLGVGRWSKKAKILSTLLKNALRGHSERQQSIDCRVVLSLKTFARLLKKIVN